MSETTGTGGTAMKRATVLNDAVLQASKPRGVTKTQASNQTQIAIADNPFYKLMFDPSKSLEERKAEITRLGISTLDSKQDRANTKAYDEFREWLSSQQTELAEQIIALSNIDSMAELQSVLNDMNTDLIGFEDKMNPIMDIIESIHYLRTNDLIGDAFRDFEREKAEDEQRKAEAARVEAEIAEKNRTIAQQDEIRINALTKRSLFGLGGMTAAAVREKAMAEEAIEAAKASKVELDAKAKELRAAKPVATRDGDEVAYHKGRLKELLDMSRGENQERMIQLRDSASRFINTARDRTGSLRDQFGKLASQIETAEDSNQNMIKVYAILNDGLKDANKANADMRDGLANAGENESTIDTMTREEKLRALDTHVGHLSRSQGETMATFGSLNQQAIRIHTMRGATDQQIDTARRINTEGVAATADRLATVLTAVSGAALGEAAEAAKGTLERMRRSTSDIASREVIRVAMGTSQINDQLETVFQELEDIREVQQHATGITRNAMTEMRERMEQLRESAQSAKQDLADHVASASISEGETQTTRTAQPAPSGFPKV